MRKTVQYLTEKHILISGIYSTVQRSMVKFLNCDGHPHGSLLSTFAHIVTFSFLSVSR